MTEKELQNKFQEAFKKASKTKIKLPSDIMLYFYAYYKQATYSDIGGTYAPSGDIELRNAFKLNALFQTKNLTPREAKLKYIELVNTYILD